MDAQSSSNHHRPVIATKACTPEFICGIHDLSKRIPQLNKTGDNFSVWERDLKVMIGSLTGSSDYFVCESHKHDPKFNRVVFNLIYWSIDEELQQDLDIDGSAGEAFQVLAGRFRSNLLTRCIMSRADFPEEILDNIVDMVYRQSSQEHISIMERKRERIIQAPAEDPAHVYRDQLGSPILNSFQTLAVVNRRFHRICLPKLWQKLIFPTALPAPVSIWTHDILLNRGHLVRSLTLNMDDLSEIGAEEVAGIARSIQDNTSPGDELEDSSRQGIGLVNIKKMFKACRWLETLKIDIPGDSYDTETFFPIAYCLKNLFGIIPQLRRLIVNDDGCSGLPGEFMIDCLQNLPHLVSLELCFLTFSEKSSAEESFGWSLAQHQNLRKLRLAYVTFEDQTWTLDSWLQRLETLELCSCNEPTAGMLQKLLNGSGPTLTRLDITPHRLSDDSGVDGQTDLPALKHLLLRQNASFNLLLSFQSCKDIEMILYSRPLSEHQWDLVKQLLSTSTWPKLSILDLRPAYPRINDDDPRKLTQKDVDEIWQSFKIKLFID